MSKYFFVLSNLVNIVYLTRLLKNKVNQNFDNEGDDEVIDEERLDFATERLTEISRLKSDNGEFVKALIPPLSS